jgi:nickel-dependent lactate racemase
MMPALLHEIRGAGIPVSAIKILVATGLHRPMTKEEMIVRFGSEVAGKIQIINHDANDKGALVTLGTTSDGTLIQINKLALESDFIISSGCIEPHRVAGFSGGTKMVQPGICGKDITAALHWKGWCTEGAAIYGIVDNPIRSEMNEIGRKAGLRFILNVVLDNEGIPFQYFAGDPIKAFYEGCKASRSLHTIDIEPADIVVVDSYPFDLDLWQACKALSVGELVLKSGGYIILVTPCPEKLGLYSREIQITGYLNSSQIMAAVADKAIGNLAVACHLMALGRILEHAHLIIVSPGFTEAELAEVGLQYSKDVNSAIQQARNHLGKESNIAILNKPCAMIPRINTR